MSVTTQARPLCFRSGLCVPGNAHPLVRALYAEMIQLGLSEAEVERRAGISDGLLRSWRTAKSPQVANIAAALEVVGLQLIVVPMTKGRD